MPPRKDAGKRKREGKRGEEKQKISPVGRKTHFVPVSVMRWKKGKWFQ